MKRSILFCLCFLGSTFLFSQNFSKLKNATFDTKEDCKFAHNQVLECVNYCLTTSFDKNDKNRSYANDYILLWMIKTPDFSFAINDQVTSLTKKNNDLLFLYMISMVKVALENEHKLSSNDINLQAEKIFLDYCSKNSSKIKLSKEIRKKLSEL